MTELHTSDPAQFIREVVEPAHTAVLTVELQRGVVGDGATFPALVEEVARTGMLATAGRVCAAARDAGTRVVHCTVESRPDGAGTATNCKILALAARARREGNSPIEAGSTGARLVPELGEDSRDIVVSRLHGLTPFPSTSLDQILRNLGVRTVVVTGVSVNLAVLGTVMSAVDLGYQVVLVRDAVVGVPADYADEVIENSLSLVSTVVTSDELLEAWTVGQSG